MKLIFVVLLTIIFPLFASAQSYKCVASDGTVYQSKFSCDPETVERFVNRFAGLCPDALQKDMSREDMKGLFHIAMGTCDEPFKSMTPEEVGKNSAPFFPWEMTAAMAQAAREIICP